MKTLLQKCALLCLGLTAMLLYSCNPSEEMAKGKLSIIEDSVDLDKNSLSETTGIQQMATCEDSILINCSDTLPRIADSIPKNAFQILKEIAINLKGDFSGHYIPALRIYYGLNATMNKMKLFYQPVFLKRKSGTGPDTNVEYIPVSSSNYYKYNGSTFSVVSNSIVVNAKNLYTAHIKFKQDDTCRSFNPLQDSTGDIKGCLFSFQEIEKVIHDNTSNSLYILNSGEIMRIGGIDYLKHIIILGPDNLPHVLDFYRKYGNLSHLCPPSCNNQNVFYDILK